MEWTWTKANEKELAQFATDSALQLFNLDVSSFDLIREEQFEDLIRAIYDTLVEQQIKYDFEKFSSAEFHQRIRTPVEILSQPRQGTCLDLALLFCGLCLGCNLLPKLILLEGHALVVVSLVLNRSQWDANKNKQKDFIGRTTRDSEGNEIREFEVFRNLQALKDGIDDYNIYCAVECTGFAYSKTLQPGSTELAGFTRSAEGFLTFEQAKEVGRKQLDRLPFKYAIDIAVAHEAWGIKPVSFEVPNSWEKPVISKMYGELDLEKFDGGTAIVNLEEGDGPVDMEAHLKAKEVKDAFLLGNYRKGNTSSGNSRTKQELDKVNRSNVEGERHQNL